ncbi:hypothetical protein JAAARDRAFT_51908, partial [Jaapia argillacea MUCL 33604]
FPPEIFFKIHREIAPADYLTHLHLSQVCQLMRAMYDVQVWRRLLQELGCGIPSCAYSRSLWYSHDTSPVLCYLDVAQHLGCHQWTCQFQCSGRLSPVTDTTNHFPHHIEMVAVPFVLTSDHAEVWDVPNSGIPESKLYLHPIAACILFTMPPVNAVTMVLMRGGRPFMVTNPLGVTVWDVQVGICQDLMRSLTFKELLDIREANPRSKNMDQSFAPINQLLRWVSDDQERDFYLEDALICMMDLLVGEDLQKAKCSLCYFKLVGQVFEGVWIRGRSDDDV